MLRHEDGVVRIRTTARPPVLAVGIALAGLAVFVGLPLTALIVRVPWSSLGGELGDPAVRDALRISLLCSVSAAAISVVLGVPIAWLLARTSFPGRAVVRALALVPLVLPPVVGGIALLAAFGRRGVAGRLLDDWFGVRLPFTTGGAILAATFVALPFLVLTVEGALRSFDRRYEDAAATLGAQPWTIMRRVTLPAIAPSVAVGALLAWARALGEFGATITFAGNLRGETQTLPLAAYLLLQSDPGAALSVSLVLLAMSTAVLVVAGRRVFGR